MKAKHGLFLFLTGICVDIIAVIFKIQHWPGAGVLFIVGTLPKLLGLALLGWKIWSYPDFQDFLDH